MMNIILLISLFHCNFTIFLNIKLDLYIQICISFAIKNVVKNSSNIIFKKLHQICPKILIYM